MNRYATGALFSLLILVSCTPYVITIPLSEPLKSPGTCAVGDMEDQLPLDLDIEKRPTREEVDQFRAEIDRQLREKALFDMLDFADGADYEVTGEILEFKRGSGAARFFIGFGVGNAKMTVALRLIDKASNDDAIFAGNFSAEVGDWATKGSKMYNTTASNFAKALKKELKRLEKERKSKSS